MFLGFFALCSGVLIGVLAMSNEQRVRQQTITDVEQEGMQFLQMLTRRMRSAERIILPVAGSTGSVLVLQMSDQSQDPTIIALQTGSVKVAESSTVRVLSSSGIVISNIVFRNTSVSANRQSGQINFVVTRSVPIPTGGTYTRPFGTSVVLFSDDDPGGNSCGCAVPVCSNGWLSWGYCEGEVCEDVGEVVPCD